MIFVTVGTHEQQFNRLIEYIDNLKQNGEIKDDIIIQTGFSTYEPKYCKWKKIIPYEEMIENIKKADVIITHGGPATFILPLEFGKVPIVVPRQLKFDEHVNDHQVEFITAISEKTGSIIPVYEINDLNNIILNYKKISMNKYCISNNKKFCEDFSKIISKVMRK